MLVGTQCDLRNDVKVLIELNKYNDKPVTEAQARQLAKDIDAECYVECSALTQKNLKEVFDEAILVSLDSRGCLPKRADRKTRSSRSKNSKRAKKQQQQSQHTLQCSHDAMTSDWTFSGAAAADRSPSLQRRDCRAKKGLRKLCCFR